MVNNKQSFISALKKQCLKFLQNLQQNTSAEFSFFVEVADDFIKKRLHHKLFSCEFSKTFQNSFLQNSPGELLLKYSIINERCFMDFVFHLLLRAFFITVFYLIFEICNVEKCFIFEKHLLVKGLRSRKIYVTVIF